MSASLRQAVALRAVRASDFSCLRDLRNDIPLQKMLMAHPTPQDDAAVQSWLDRRTSDPHGAFRLITLGDKPVGFVQIVDIHRIDLYGRLGIAIASAYQGQGIGAAAMREALGMAANELKLRKILVEVRADNLSAISLYRRLGFTDVGILKDHYCEDGAFVDVMILEIFPRAYVS